MPKRPCTITLTPNNSTIVCGDKFGDVYSLPLLGTTYETKKRRNSNGLNGDEAEQTQSAFTPAANSRTVHTKKNQEALRNQQKQLKNKTEKQVLQFEHQLLLGHVSLLTDLIYVQLDNEESPSGKSREYILTSDRDEHIRVSRGIPQAHIIEGYCLGHTEFVSKICAPRRNRQLLVSGGGDDYLLVWNWMSGTVKQKVGLRRYLVGLEHLNRVPDDPETTITVSGIWDTPSSEQNTQEVDLIVTLEAYISLFPFKR